MSEADNSEVSITSEGVTLKGAPARELVQPVRRVAQTADSVLRLLGNLVALPADYLSNNIERLRFKYAARFEEIPLESRQQPPERIGYSVVRQAALSADEPALQDLFANLLASASDARAADDVHPGFPDVIAGMRWIDARVLVTIACYVEDRPDTELELPLRLEGVDAASVSIAVSNLIRLGLLDLRAKSVSNLELQRMSRRSPMTNFVRGRAVPRDMQGLERELERLVEDTKLELLRDVERIQRRQVMVVTAFGRAFIKTAISRDASVDRVDPLHRIAEGE